jgi:hypothetical protein
MVGTVFGAAVGIAFDTAFDRTGRVAVRGVDVAVTRGVVAVWGRRAAMESPNVEGSSCPAQTMRSRRVVVD